MARSRKTKSTKRSIDFSKAGKNFEKDQAYHFIVKEASWEEGAKGEYIALVLGGVDEYENSTIYHNLSFSDKSLPYTREALEHMGYEVNDEGDTDIDTAELVGLEVMGETYEDRYDGGKSIKIDSFYPVEDSGKGSSSKSSGKGAGKSSKKDEPELDLDGLDEDDLKKLAKALGINIRRKDEDQLREAILEEGEDDIRAAAKKAKIDLDAGGDNGDDELDLSEVEEDDLKAIAKKLKVKGYAKMDEDDLREALGELDADDVRGAAEELDIDLDGGEPEESKGKGKKGSSKGGSEKKSKKGFSEDDIQDMSEEQLEEVVDDHKLDVDLDKLKTLRKKQNAVIDALEAEGLIEG